MKGVNYNIGLWHNIWISSHYRFLSTGDSYKTIARSYRMGFRTVSKCVMKVCSAIVSVLTPIEMPLPTTRMWLEQAQLFQELWQFPNCISAIDGKHVIIVAPRRSGSMFHNYKGTKSIVLLAIVGADYRFVSVDIGSYGKNSDGGIFERSTMGRRFAADRMDVPSPSPLPGTTTMSPYTLVGDEAFALSKFMMRPYQRRQTTHDQSKRNFNYRLSRARRIVENGFGILTQRWRIFMRPLGIPPQSVNTVVMAAVLLHNYLTPKSFDYVRTAPASSGIIPIPRPQRLNASQRIRENLEIRERLRRYIDDNPI